ncbi:MAG: hypothetical protein IJT72_04320, partial [Lachnospiraceae bacterium]|nr:hypothetical protein [Lachnospiraceae bacterium]
MKRNSIKKRIMCIVFSALVILATCATSSIKVYADGAYVDSLSFMLSTGSAQLTPGAELHDYYDYETKTCLGNDLTSITVSGGSLTLSKDDSGNIFGNDNLSIHVYASGRLNLDSDTTLKCSYITWDTNGLSQIYGTVLIGSTLKLGEDDFTPNFTFDGSSLSANKIIVDKGSFTNAGSSASVTTSSLESSSGTTVSNSNVMNATGITNNGTFINYGTATLTTDSFVNNGSITNSSGGVINATSFENAGTVTNNGTINVSSSLIIKKSNGETYYVDDGATVIFDENLTQTSNLPTIITGPNTTITDVGHKASYKLKVGTGEVKEITTGTGWADTIPAGELNKKQRSLSISGSASIYYGVEYTEDFFTSQISDLDDVAIEFDGCTFQDVTNPDNPVTLTELPTNVGTYKVFTKIKATSEYRDCGTYFPAIPDTFLISYFPSTELSEKCTLSAEPVCTIGSSNYNLYKGGVKYIAPAGFSISNELDGTYAKSITLEEGYNYGSDDIYYKRDEDGATTNAVSYTAYPFLVDNSNPEIIYSSDQDGADVVIKEGTSTVRARSVSITIEDMVSDFSTIDSVTLNGSTDGVSIGSDGRVEVALKMILPGKKTYEIVATDLVG